MAVIAVGILIFCDHREQKFSTLMVERGVLGFPKHNLAVSLWTPCFGKSKSNTIENTAEVRPVAGGAKPPRNGSFSLC